MKAIVEHFKRSPLATQRLKAMQKQLGDKEVKLKQDVITRWNSTYTMFQSVIGAKNSLMSIIAIDYPDLDNINNDDLEILTTRDVDNDSDTEKGQPQSQNNRTRSIWDDFDQQVYTYRKKLVPWFVDKNKIIS
ncbi:hypothetical protein EVAR_88915_1 [Eumeta japonica]|uniref:Zinc finger BED domain-containing protein 4 n=1 Tax=Eumeta variegata TaxID=151549 RepID=A0A4C1VSR0_EUMVA|nr:hypothetical protein EVAR_88915_1 [Eumeta japonica]